MTESDEIEEILYEAYNLGVKDLVMEEAKNIWMNNNNMRRSEAYRRAFDYYKKNIPVKIGSGGIIGDIKQSEK